MKKEKMKTDFELLCKKISKCKKCEPANPIMCAEKYTREYVDGDKEKLLRLKAEAKKEDIQNYASTMLALAAIMLSVVAIIWNVSEAVSECMKADGSFCYHVAAAVLYCITAVGEIYCCVAAAWIFWNIWRKSQIVGKWGAYVEVVLDEIEKEMKKEMEKDQNRLEKRINDLAIEIREMKKTSTP